MTSSFADAHLVSNFSWQLNEDFHESQHEISRHGRRFFMCKVVQAENLSFLKSLNRS